MASVDADADGVNGRRTSTSRTADDILEIVRSVGTATMQDLMGRTSLPSSTLYRHLARLEQDGLISRSKGQIRLTTKGATTTPVADSHDENRSVVVVRSSSLREDRTSEKDKTAFSEGRGAVPSTENSHLQPQRENPLVARMVEAGLTEAKARYLASRYAVEKIETQLRNLALAQKYGKKPVVYTGRWLTMALDDDWPIPPAYLAKEAAEKQQGVKVQSNEDLLAQRRRFAEEEQQVRDYLVAHAEDMTIDDEARRLTPDTAASYGPAYARLWAINARMWVARRRLGLPPLDDPSELLEALPPAPPPGPGPAPLRRLLLGAAKPADPTDPVTMRVHAQEKAGRAAS